MHTRRQVQRSPCIADLVYRLIWITSKYVLATKQGKKVLLVNGRISFLKSKEVKIPALKPLHAAPPSDAMHEGHQLG
jgi:hypothetical protein